MKKIMGYLTALCFLLFSITSCSYQKVYSDNYIALEKVEKLKNNETEFCKEILNLLQKKPKTISPEAIYYAGNCALNLDEQKEAIRYYNWAASCQEPKSINKLNEFNITPPESQYSPYLQYYPLDYKEE